MRILFATAEFEPVAMVGGLGAASAGLVRELRRTGEQVLVALPDYGGVVLQDETRTTLEVPSWVGTATVRRGVHAVAGELALIAVPNMARNHPYLQPSGEGWVDNDVRFLRFSAAVAALCRSEKPDLLHLNDWHTATALADFDKAPPSVLSIHNLVYQGITSPTWIKRIGPRASAYEHNGDCNPLAGGIILADRIVVVSPNYAKEIRTPANGAGLHTMLTERGDSLVGILNGIDDDAWNPAKDEFIKRSYSTWTIPRKAMNRTALRRELGLRDRGDAPIFVVLSRLAHQKGIDLLLPLLPFLQQMPAQLAVLGAGEATTVLALREAVARSRGDVAFVEGYDEGFAHRLLAGGDVLLMPSRFEPCGLTQLQAMRYGTLPMATDVGGLHDTIIDLDRDPAHGTGWLAAQAEPLAILDAMHRAARGCQNKSHRKAAQKRAMSADWSWREPAKAYLDVYARAQARKPAPRTR